MLIGREQVAVLRSRRDVLLGDHEHAAGAAARVVDGADDLPLPDAILVAGEHQVDHQVDHVARREVLAGVLVERLVELPDQLLEDRAHRRVVDSIRVQVDVLELLEHLEEQPASSSLLMVLSKSNFSSTSRMFGLKPAM